MAKKNIEHICKNCRLFDARENLCKVVIMLPQINAKGESYTQKINLPVDAEDPCFFEQEVTATNKEIFADGNRTTVEKFIPADDIKEVKMWVEDPITGKKSDKGIVKIEYPEGFFGKT